MFSTVPTALGKLGKLRPSFPQFPQPLRLDTLIARKRQKQNPLTGLANSYGQDVNESVKNHSSRPTPMAGFEVFINGRF